MKKTYKIISLVLTACIIVLSMSIVANAEDLLVKYESEGTFTVTIPEYIEAVAKDVSSAEQSVTASDVMLEPDTELNVSVSYNGTLVHRDDPDVSLGYDIYLNEGGGGTGFAFKR